MRLIALTGIALKSTGVVPLPILLSVLTSALVWRRLPLTSTRTWSGLMPRSCAARTWSAPPELDWRGKLNDGSSACSALPSSPLSTPALRMSSAVSTSMGEVDSSTVRSLARVPVTMTVSRLVAAAGFGGVLREGRDGERQGDGDAERRHERGGTWDSWGFEMGGDARSDVCSARQRRGRHGMGKQHHGQSSQPRHRGMQIP